MELLTRIGVTILTLICFLLLSTGENISSSEVHDDQQRSNQSLADAPAGVCSYEDVLNYLNLTRSNDRYTMSRPVKDHRHKTEITLQMVIYAILDVREADQTFISYIWIYMLWNNEYISWNKNDFCGISYIEVPAESLWKPDLTIEEMVEKDKSPPVPFLCIYNNNTVELRADQVVVSTCQMHVYKFPFDVQTCNLTFKSVLYPDDELTIIVSEDNEDLTNWSRRVMDSQYEWVFLNMSATTEIVNYFNFNQTAIVYTVKMRRRSVLFVANLLLPILFLLCLDFASFLMPDSGGEKIGFKITVLLAVTVMQLVLNEILPASSNSIPIIVIYCVGIFAFMLLSLLEAIFVKYLTEKDSVIQDSQTDESKLKEKRETKTSFPSASIYDKTDFGTSSIYKEDSSSQMTEIFLAVERVSDELREMKNAFIFTNKNTEVKQEYWTSVAKRVNKVFTAFYATGIFVFLCTVFSLWMSESDLNL